MNEKSDVITYFSIEEKIKQVVDYLGKFDGILVAFSGGVDSSTLAALTRKAQGDRAAAITADSQTLPRRELKSSIKTAESIGIKHIIIPYSELEEPGFAQNPTDRCYYCKSGLFRLMKSMARELDLEKVADGTNATELTGYRPGHRAAIEHGILTPFADLGVTKNEIREMAYNLGLRIWDRSQQACLSSRFPYGSHITLEGLKRVEMAEDCLFDLGVVQCRVRIHDSIARIEVQPVEFDLLIKNRDHIINRLKELGFTYITLDIEGFRSGSFDTFVSSTSE